MKTVLTLMIILLGVCCTNITQAQPIIIDHTCTDINKIPQQWIEAAKRDLLISYGHTSHGGQLVTGIEAIRTFKGAPFDFTSVSDRYVPGVFLVDVYFITDEIWQNLTNVDKAIIHSFMLTEVSTLRMIGASRFGNFLMKYAE